MEDQRPPSFLVDRSNLPPRYPTHLHDEAFWCSLGRAVATFGFLEEMLKKAVYALTGSCAAPTDEDAAKAAVEEWGELLGRALVNPLNPVIDTFAKAAKDHPEQRLQNLDEFVRNLRAAARIRNVICHGSWNAPDANGASRPFYVTGKPGEQQVFETPITVAWLDQLQAHTCELACEVVNTVTHMGYQFPGSNGPGRPLGNGNG
ncbi:MAG: hypothetical protein K8J09_06710 [Planctomycetes bacterium]|nr:hypothetical protein [Planctomycetota bacterium]MCC7399721.1 hypothetical protein [Planctomycetota bacterium]